MSAFWVRFNGHRPMCVEGKTLALARARAETVGEVVDIRTLPYPAEPRMEPYESVGVLNPRTGGVQSVVCPAFCYDPERCAGRTACPKDYACSE